VKVNLPTTADGAIKVLEYKFPGAPKQPAVYPIELTPLVKTQYFEARPKMSIIGMLMGNPMMLMMGLMVIGMTVFPKLLGAFARNSPFLPPELCKLLYCANAHLSFFHRRLKPHPCKYNCQMAGEDVMKEFTEQQTKMQEEMGDASDPMAMFKKILSGEGMDEPKPAAAPPAVTSGGSTAKRSKKQRD